MPSRESNCLVMNGYQGVVSGGVQIDGTLIAPVIEDEVREQAAAIKAKGLRSVAILGLYSPMDRKYGQEEHVRRVLQEELGPDVDIVCSKESASRPPVSVLVCMFVNVPPPPADSVVF